MEPDFHRRARLLGSPAAREPIPRDLLVRGLERLERIQGKKRSHRMGIPPPATPRPRGDRHGRWPRQNAVHRRTPRYAQVGQLGEDTIELRPMICDGFDQSRHVRGVCPSHW